MVLTTPMVLTETIGSTGTPESLTYERAECCSFAGFFLVAFQNGFSVAAKSTLYLTRPPTMSKYKVTWCTFPDSFETVGDW